MNTYDTSPNDPAATAYADPPDLIFLSAAASIRACAIPAEGDDALPDLTALADRLERALYSDCIYDPNDCAALLATQARTMDAVFHAMIQHGFRDRRFPSEEKLRVAILAQRQSALTIDRLKHHQTREKAHDFRVNREFNKRTER